MKRKMRWPSVAAVLLVAGCATARPSLAGVGGSAQAGRWPDYDAGGEALLAPFLACASPAEFVELQRGVDMSRLVAALDDWSAVRLGAMGPRLPAKPALLEQVRPRVDAPPPGVPRDFPLWRDYLAYWERRLAELKAGQKAKGPLRWGGYQGLMEQYARGLEFQRTMTDLLRADAKLLPKQRRWLGDFEQPSIETNVGVAKPGVDGVRYADVLVSEGKPGLPPRVETFSFKSRDFNGFIKSEAVVAKMKADAAAALRFYGETLDIRRPSLKHLGREVQVRRVRLVYEGGELMPKVEDVLSKALRDARKGAQGVEVDVQ